MGLQQREKDGWMIGVLQHFEHVESSHIMPEIVWSLLVRPMACIKEIIRLGWILWKRSLRSEAVYKFLVNDIKIYTVSICSTVSKELQGTHIGGSSSFKSGLDMYDLFWDDYKAFVSGELRQKNRRDGTRGEGRKGRERVVPPFFSNSWFISYQYHECYSEPNSHTAHKTSSLMFCRENKPMLLAHCNTDQVHSSYIIPWTASTGYSCWIRYVCLLYWAGRLWHDKDSCSGRLPSDRSIALYCL